MSEMNVYTFSDAPAGGPLLTLDCRGASTLEHRAPTPRVRALVDPETAPRALARVDPASLDLAVAEFLAALAREGELSDRAAS